MPEVIPFPEDIRRFVEATKWRFAKTYAATWPHEYVVKTPENAAAILALAAHISSHGVHGRFYSDVRKYHHEGGKVYWFMDDSPEELQRISDLRNAIGFRYTAVITPTRLRYASDFEWCSNA